MRLNILDFGADKNGNMLSTAAVQAAAVFMLTVITATMKFQKKKSL